MCLQPGKLKAVLRIGETQARDLAIGQPALIDTRNGMVRGHVSRMDPAAQGGTVAIDVAIDGALPPGARRDVNVDGTIQLQRLNNIVFTGRPTIAQDHALIGMFMGASRLVDGTARGGGRETPLQSAGAMYAFSTSSRILRACAWTPEGGSTTCTS